MSLLNGLARGFASFADDAMKDEAMRQPVPLLNRVAPAPEAVAQPPPGAIATPAPVAEMDNPATGNKLDKGTLERARMVYDGLVARGMDPSTAIGFAANAVQESRANPATNPGDMGASHGLMQWRDDRHAGFVNKFGASTKMDDALDYILHELSGPESRAWAAIQSAPDDPAAKAAAVSAHYERPKDRAAEIARRSFIAQRLASQFLGGA